MDIPRLSPKERLILEMLVSHGEMYGLELVGSSEGQLKKGTVYVTLNRMADKGFVESRKVAAPEDQGGLPRRLYSVTGLGGRVLQAWELARAVLQGATV